MAQFSRSAAAAGVAAVVLVTIAVVVNLPNEQFSALIEKDARRFVSGEKLVATDESLAARAQMKLALKDNRIYRSIAQAARKQVLDAEHEDEKFDQARKEQIALDQQLAELSDKFHAQEQALAYMAPRLEYRGKSTEELASLVQQLDQVVPKIRPDLNQIKEQLQNIKDAGKQAKEQIMTADEELVKSKNAYNLFGKRMYEAREKAANARQNQEELHVMAVRAQQDATELRQEAVQTRDKAKSKLLVADSDREEARSDMLNKQSTEAVQSAQLYDAEADEALAYLSMFGADAQQASTRLQTESQKLQALGRQYQRGKMLEQQGQYKDEYLKSELKKAQGALGRSEVKLNDDKLAFMTGEKATMATHGELHVEDMATEENTVKAEKYIKKLDKEKEQWEYDSSQDDSIKEAGEAHEDAAEHLERAAVAAEEDTK